MNRFIVLVAVCALVLAATAQAAIVNYQATLVPINGSTAGGTVLITLDDRTLTVQVKATGLEPLFTHEQQIRGLINASGTPVPSAMPTAANDTDHDGFIEDFEAEQAVGQDLLPLTNPPTGDPSDYPKAAADGTETFLEIYTITPHQLSLMSPLETRMVELHGMTVSSDTTGLGTFGEVDGVAGFKAVLPVAVGQIQLVPEPLALCLLAMGSLTLLRRRK